MHEIGINLLAMTVSNENTGYDLCDYPSLTLYGVKRKHQIRTRVGKNYHLSLKITNLYQAGPDYIPQGIFWNYLISDNRQ